MFGLMSFPVLEEEPPSAPDGTYPDDANQRVVVDPRASEAKRDEAFALLVFTHVLLGSTGAVLLWPFLLGTLLRRADARELSKEPGHSSDEKDENEDVRGEVKLVQLLRLGGLVRHPYASWLPRLLAVVESGKTPDVLKVALIEHLAINRVTPNSSKIVTSLLEGVVKRATTSDKVRACAVFAVGYLLHRNTAGNERLRTTWAYFFYKPTADEPAAVRFGLLAQTAMAWVAVNYLGEQAPDAAINQAVDALIHDLEFLSAWRVMEGGDALLQPRGLAYVPVAKLLDLDKASLSDLNEKLRHGINISSRASLETASVMWPSLESFDEFFTGPLIKLRFGRAKPHLVSSLLDQLGTSSSDRAIQRLASCLIAVTLPSAFAEGTVRQEVEREDPDALGVLRRLADEPQFDNLWHWIGRQADAKAKKGRQPVLARMDHDFGSKVQGLPLTSRADLQRFLDAPLPAHWSTGKWMPDLTGLDDEDWTIGQQAIQDRCAMIIRGLASRSEEVQRFRSMCLWTLWRVEHDARLAIKWVVKLVGCKRVIDAARLVDRLLIPCAVATAQLAPITFDVAGFDRKCLPPTGGLHDDVGQYMQDYLELLRDGDQPESVRTQILNLLAMFPEHWPVTLPHVATLWNTAAESLSLRAAALSTISFIVPATPDLWQACSHEDREQARRAIAELTSFLPPLPGVVSLRDVAASALASSPVGKLSGNDWEGLPEELRGLMERKAWACTKNNEFYRNLQAIPLFLTSITFSSSS